VNNFKAIVNCVWAIGLVFGGPFYVGTKKNTEGNCRKSRQAHFFIGVFTVFLNIYFGRSEPPKDKDSGAFVLFFVPITWYFFRKIFFCPKEDFKGGNSPPQLIYFTGILLKSRVCPHDTPH
jgi:hypothetical protein